MQAWAQFVVAGIFGGLLALERRAVLQAMLSRPLIAATLTGLLLGDVDAGLAVGMLLELFHLGSASLGAAIPENDTLAATGTAAAAVAMTADTGTTPAIISFAIILFAGLGPAGRLVDHRLDRFTSRLLVTATQAAEVGDLRRAVRQNLWGMWPYFVVFGALTALCYGAGTVLAPLVQRFPPDLVRGLAWAYPAMASVAAAIAVRGSHARRAILLAGASAAVVLIWVAASSVMGWHL